MKKISFLLLAFVLFVASSPVKDFEGTITFSIEYLDVPEEIQGMESMLPSSMRYSIKGSKVRIEQSLMGGSQIVLADQEEKTGDVLMDMMGQRIHVHMSKEELEAEEAKNTEKPTITYSKETKKVNGYKCNKATLVAKDGAKTVLWYSKEIEVKHNDYKELDGFPLEYETTADGMTMRITATNIERKSLAETHFEVPAGYTKMTLEELGSMMGN